MNAMARQRAARRYVLVRRCVEVFRVRSEVLSVKRAELAGRGKKKMAEIMGGNDGGEMF
jgi:hypothetical protein